MRRWALVLTTAAGLAAPVQAQDVAPAPVAKPEATPAPAPVSDSDVAPFYATHAGTLVWLGSADAKAVITAGALRDAVAGFDAVHELESLPEADGAAGDPGVDPEGDLAVLPF